MCKLSKTAEFLAGRHNRVGRAIWQEFFGPTWGEVDVSSLGERGMRDIGVTQTRYGLMTDDVIAPSPSERDGEAEQPQTVH